jgi:hypothetical protein
MPGADAAKRRSRAEIEAVERTGALASRFATGPIRIIDGRMTAQQEAPCRA